MSLERLKLTAELSPVQVTTKRVRITGASTRIRNRYTAPQGEAPDYSVANPHPNCVTISQQLTRNEGFLGKISSTNHQWFVVECPNVKGAEVMSMSRGTTGRFPGLIAAVVAVLALSSTAAVTLAGFSAQIVNNANTFSSGTMQLEETQGGTNCYSTGSGSGGSVTSSNSVTCAINKLIGTLDQVPVGTPLTTSITMKNVGNTTAALESLVFATCSAAAASDASGYVGSDTAGFCGKVDFSVGYGTKCLYPANAAAACAATPTSAGTLTGANTVGTINQASTPPMVLLAPAATQAYTFTVMLDTSATNADQGLTASQTMTWNQS